MRRTVVALVACMLMVFGSASAFANLDQFAGKWENIDANTRGLTRLEISVVDSKVKVHAYGACEPYDCDLGEVEGIAYAPNINSRIKETAQAVTAAYAGGERIMVIRPEADNRLQVETFTRFTDRSGRANYTTSHTFARRK